MSLFLFQLAEQSSIHFSFILNRISIMFLAQAEKQGSFCFIRCPYPALQHSLRHISVSVCKAQMIFCSSSFLLLKFIDIILVHSNGDDAIRALIIFIVIMDKSQYREEGYRFVVILTYLAAALVNSIPVHTFSSINVAAERIFRISSTQVTMNALLFTIAHPLFAFPCNWLINKKGMRVSFMVGAVFTIGGVWLRLLIQEENSIFCLIGSGLAAIGSIFVLNTPSKVAINWFRSDMVNMASFTGILFNLLSVTLGASLPGYLINDTTSTAEDVKRLIFIEACVITVPYILLVIFFRDAPNQPPSKSASALLNQKPQKYNDLLKQLFKNKEYLKLMASMSLNYGTLTATIAVLDQAIKGLNYTNSSQITSSTILSAMLIGVLGNPLFSMLLRGTKAYRAVSGLATFGGFFMFTLLMIAYVYQVTNTVYILILGGLLGFYLIPLPSIMIMYGSQLVFPLDESSSAGYLLAASQTFGFAIGLGAISVLNKTEERSKIVLFTFSGFLFLSFLIVLTVKENLNKMRFSMDASSHEKTDNSESLLIKDVQDS